MNCDMARDRLDSYVGGTLPAVERSAVASHLEVCDSCRADLAALEAVRAELPALGRKQDRPDVEGMWAAIRPRLVQQRRQGWARRPLAVPPWAMAAAAALLMVASVGTTMLLVKRHTGDAPSARLTALEADYESASAELAPLLAEARTRLEPATMAALERNLAAIDSALTEVRRALAADPYNLTLERFVLSAWRQKVDLLRRATTTLGSET